MKLDNEKNEKLVGEGVGFERIRRITGYLVGTVDRFNNGKKAETPSKITKSELKTGAHIPACNKKLFNHKFIPSKKFIFITS